MAMKESIVALQHRDHEKLRQLVAEYRSGNSNTRPATFRALVDLVTRHAFAEEEVLFPAARRVLAEGESLTSDIEHKHQRANELLTELEAFEPGDPAFEARAELLFAILLDDASEEETQLLPRLTEMMSSEELERVGGTWAIAKTLAPNRSHPRVPRRPPGNVLAGIPLLFVDRVRSVVARLRNTAQ